MSAYLDAVRKAWAREHDPATQAAYEAMQTARRALVAAPAESKRAARKAFALAECAYCHAIHDVPIHRPIGGES